MVIHTMKNEFVTRVQILDEAVSISLRANALRKGMNTSIIFPDMVR